MNSTPVRPPKFRSAVLLFLLTTIVSSIVTTTHAQIGIPTFGNSKPRTTPVGLPQDAGPHDADATIEWWYYNAFFKTESGKEYAVVCSFFRTGLPGGKKGHYLIYSLADLAAKTKKAYSVLDSTNIALLQSFLPLAASQRPNDPQPMQLLALLQQNKLPAPHLNLNAPATVAAKPLFSIGFGKDNIFEQATPNARSWRGALKGDGWNLNLSLSQKESTPPMLVGGEGKTGLARPDDMFYISLTRMDASGDLTMNGKTERVTGIGWVDRQWGTSWVVQNNGWDWFGLHLDDGSDLIVYRVVDNDTKKILRAEATLLRPDGTQIVDKIVTITPQSGATYVDKRSGIAYPSRFDIRIKTLGIAITVTPEFPDQTIPVLGIGDAIWEGVVRVNGTNAGGTTISGRGYMELVGYTKPVAVKKRVAATANPKKRVPPRGK